MENQEIQSVLYDLYYKHDRTPSSNYSLFWREMHEKAKVVSVDGQVKTVFAEGFGDLQIKSLPYTFFSHLNAFLYLLKLKDKKIVRILNIAKKLCRRLEISFTINCLLQVCSAAFISRYIDSKKQLRVINIGDGYGFLSILLKEIFPNAKITLVDLGKTLLFQTEFCNKAYPSKKHTLIIDGIKKDKIDSSDFVYCPSEKVSLLDSQKFDLAINIHSMGEMNNDTIRHYFEFLRNHLAPENYFYCCNRVF